MVSQKMYQLGVMSSSIRELFEYGLALAEKVGRENVFDYSLGNPSVPAPKQVDTALGQLASKDSLSLHSYTSAEGAADVRKVVAKDLADRFGMEICPQNLFFTCGAAPALTSVLRALAVENAEIMGIAPCFPEYSVFVETSGADFVLVPADTETFQIPLKELEARLTAHTQAVIVNTPNNPSGAVYSREALQALADVLETKSKEYGHPIYIIADEPYRELVYDGVEAPFIPTIYPNTIVCYSYSKSLSLPGERIGYVCVPNCVEEHARVLAAIKGAARAQGHVCAPSLIQKVIAQCIGVKPNLAAYDRNRKLLYESLTEYGYTCVKPQGAFYLFVKAPGGDAVAFSEKAKAHRLLLVPGDDFGCKGYFRMSTCVDHDMILRSLPVFKELIHC